MNENEPSSQEGYEEEMGKIRKDIVDFHGEMVLLVNYSNINYTGKSRKSKSQPFEHFLFSNEILELKYPILLLKHFLFCR